MTAGRQKKNEHKSTDVLRWKPTFLLLFNVHTTRQFTQARPLLATCGVLLSWRDPRTSTFSTSYAFTHWKEVVFLWTSPLTMSFGSPNTKFSVYAASNKSSGADVTFPLFRTPLEVVALLNQELENYSKKLVEKPALLVLNKIDISPDKEVSSSKSLLCWVCSI